MTYTDTDSRGEEGVEVPWERLDPETLRNLVSEFVTRDGEELGEGRYTLEQKVEQVLEQLRRRKARVVFDATSSSCNIVVV